MRFLLSASVALATLISFDAYAQTCQKAPDCASLGYTKSASECSGRTYTVCPFDMTKYSCDTTTCEDMAYTDTVSECPGEYDVCPYDKTKGKCIYEARPGDLKYSLRKKAHNGWLPCDGSIYSSAQFPELYEAINDSFGNRLPNYNNSFLKAKYGYSGTSLATKEEAGLPNITGSLWMVAESPYNGAFYSMAKGSALYDSGGKGGYGYDHTIGFDASKSSSIYGKSSTVTPQNYPANVFIYAGKRKEIQASASTCVKGNYLYSDGSCSSSYTSSKTLLGMVTYAYNGDAKGLASTGYIEYVYGGISAITGFDNVKIKCSGISNVNDINSLNIDIANIYDAKDLLSMNIASNSVVQKPVSGRQYWGDIGFGEYKCDSSTCTQIDIDRTSGSGYYYCSKIMYLYNK